MADITTGLPIRTESAGDAVIKVCDSTVTTQQLKVNADGSIDTNFAAGAAIEITDGTDTLAVNADGSINVAFASGAQIEITDGTDTLAVNADGSLNAVVTATDLNIRDLSASQDNVAISDGTDTLAINADGSINTNFASGSAIEITDGTDTLAVNADGSINAVVTATDLDIRDLTFATDSVDASGSTLGANDGVDIGDVTVNNAAGASAVNIQDGGNSITVDATDLDIRDLSASQDSVAISDGTDTLAVNTDG